jgi:hypothetical protein
VVKIAVEGGVWLQSRANIMRKVNRNRSAERERAQGSATAHSALLCQLIGIVEANGHGGYTPPNTPVRDFKGPVQHEAGGHGACLNV